jgi:glycine/serine hydroxymethyltransferase
MGQDNKIILKLKKIYRKIIFSKKLNNFLKSILDKTISFIAEKKDVDLPKKINSTIIPGIQGGPHLNSIAGIAVALKEAQSVKFQKYTSQIVLNAKALAQALTDDGFKLVTGGTDSHLIVADMAQYDILGNTMAEGCEVAGIVLNRNAVPNDPNPPFYPSGIRFGTPGLTTRNMKEREMKFVASWLVLVARDLQHTAKKLKMSIEDQKRPENRAAIIRRSKYLKTIREKSEALCKKFPIPEIYT